MTKTTKKTRTPAKQRSNAKRRNIVIVFIKAFSIFLWGMLCWFIATLYRNSKKNPVGATGIFIFLVLFGFVSYNALFTQKSYHNSPFFETRAQQSEMNVAQNTNAPAQATNEQGSVSQPAQISPSQMQAQTQVEQATAPAQQNTTQPTNVATNVPNVNAGQVSNTASLEQQPNAAEQATSIIGALTLPTGANAPIPVMMPKPNNSAISSSQTALNNSQRPMASQDLMNLQRQMAAAGVYSGPIDGLDGPKTRSALEKWQKRNGGVTQTASAANTDPIATNSISSNAPQTNKAPAMNANNLQQADIFRVQTGLRLFGYNKVSITGVEDKPTQDALKAFQKMFSLPQTGRISPEVIAKMREIGVFG